MDFQIAEKKYQELKNRLESGKISYQSFRMEAEKLRFQTNDGAWWQINVDDGSWLRYNGQIWVPFTPQDYMGPISLKELMVILIKNLPKSFMRSIKRKLILAVIAGVCVLIAHTILLIGPNGGFAPSNVFFNHILALQGRVMGGTLFWMIATGVVLSTYYRIKNIGMNTFRSSLTATINDFIYVVPKIVREKDPKNFAVLLTSFAIGVAYNLYTNDGVLSVMIAIWFLLAVSAGIKSFTYLLAKLTVSDVRNAMKKRSPFPKRALEVGFYGIITALLISSVLLNLPFGRIFRLILLVGAIGYGFSKQSKASMISFFIIGFGTIMTLLNNISFADDGGWSEAGGTLSGWLTSEGAAIAVMMGVPPAVGTAIAIGIIDSLISILSESTINIPEVPIGFDPVYPPFEPPVIPPVMPPFEPPVQPPVMPPFEPPVMPPVIPPFEPPVMPPVEPPVEPPVAPTEPGKTPDEIQKEKDRLEAEKQKQREEEARKKAEDQRRAEAEKQRQQEEARRRAEEQKRIEAEKRRLEAEKQKKIAELKEKQKRLEAEQAAANRSSWWWDVATTAVEGVQKGCDISIDILATVTGPAGQRVKDIYTFGKGVGEGVGNSIAEGGNVLSNVTKGATKGAYDVLKGKAMDKLAGIGGNKIPGLKQYGPGDRVGDIWKNGRVGFIKNALTGKNTHETVSNMVRDQIKEGVKNAVQSQVQSAVTKPIDDAAKDFMTSGYN